MILVLGAHGLLGTQVVKLLIARKYPTRIVTRGTSDWHDFPILKYRQSGVDVILGDISDAHIRTGALKDCTVIVNLVGSMKRHTSPNLCDTHVVLINNLVKESSDYGIERFLHVSCLSANEDSTSEYFKDKWKTEQAVRQASLDWTIFRPSFMFGERFPLLDLARPLVKFKPFLPIIGSGVNRIQPISYEDVADCILQSIYNQTMIHKSYDLAGPEVYTMTELLQLIREELKLGGPVVNLPVRSVNSVLALISKAIPGRITAELASYLTVSSLTDNQQMLKNFVVRLSSLKEVLPKIISSY